MSKEQYDLETMLKRTGKKDIYDLSLSELKKVKLTDEEVLSINPEILGPQGFVILVQRYGKVLAEETRRNPINKKELWEL